MLSNKEFSVSVIIKEFLYIYIVLVFTFDFEFVSVVGCMKDYCVMKL